MHSSFLAPIFGVMLIFFTKNIMIFGTTFIFAVSFRRIILKGSVYLIFNDRPNFIKQ
jgi:hypothetical protein